MPPIEPMILNSKKIFLIDGLGALFSTLLLGVVLVELEIYFGVPKKTLYLLAVLACLLMASSFASYWFANENWRGCLKIIAFANLLYCGITAGLLLYLYTHLTYLAVFYFLAEIAIILFLARMEFKIASR
ncbi:hypothetical protein [Flavobacterium sp. B183]|jgi:hypothetical protein|uniref:hypothetical protein n=2 Tax=Flavobacteriaceae TaxID=49546 RepID=UPI00201F937F|nr:hypothetical protein [Flavobacterium sp. B183]URC11414.1 hypothetical protein M4I44_15065 [Flavobacterium sp. B183]